jgi:hypothetical protein
MWGSRPKLGSGTVSDDFSVFLNDSSTTTKNLGPRRSIARIRTCRSESYMQIKISCRDTFLDSRLDIRGNHTKSDHNGQVSMLFSYISFAQFGNGVSLLENRLSSRHSQVEQVSVLQRLFFVLRPLPHQRIHLLLLLLDQLLHLSAMLLS